MANRLIELKFYNMIGGTIDITVHEVFKDGHVKKKSSKPLTGDEGRQRIYGSCEMYDL